MPLLNLAFSELRKFRLEEALGTLVQNEFWVINKVSFNSKREFSFDILGCKSYQVKEWPELSNLMKTRGDM